MSKGKITYELVINRRGKGNEYYFSYGSTRNIILSVTKSGTLISVQMTKDYSADPEQGKFLDLLKEGIKRAALVYLLQYQKPLHITSTTLTVLKNQQKTDIKLPDSMAFYQMFDKKLSRPISDQWKSPEVLQRILEYQKSGNELSRLMSALYAYLFSKTKNKETERFTYLWIAMNGFFQTRYPEAVRNDRLQLKLFVNDYELGKEAATAKIRDDVGKLAALELNKIEEPVTRESFKEERLKPFSNLIQIKIDKYGKKDFDTTPYGFMLTDFPYYLRCNLFHANRPIELFSFENDWELKSLRIVNGLLEEFLDQNLSSLFLKDISQIASK